MSLSARRVWIEIAFLYSLPYAGESLSARRVWIEIRTKSVSRIQQVSLSARRVWIEIEHGFWVHRMQDVTLREEGVD